MSKYVKNLVEREIARRFKDVDAVGVMNPRGINATRNNQIRRRLHEKGVRITVIKNSLARRALADSRLKGFEKLLDGPSAIVYGKVSISTIARLLMAEKKTDAAIELRGIFFDGEVYAGAEGVDRVSRMPTREEAVANILAAALSPGRKLAAIFKSPGNRLASILKTVEDKAREKEAAAPPAPAAPAAAEPQAAAPAAPPAPQAPPAPAGA